MVSDNIYTKTHYEFSVSLLIDLIGLILAVAAVIANVSGSETFSVTALIPAAFALIMGSALPPILRRTKITGWRHKSCAWRQTDPVCGNHL